MTIKPKINRQVEISLRYEYTLLLLWTHLYYLPGTVVFIRDACID